ncbi:MAG: hypothetical protein WCB10_03200 [Steroidobacteraceae bacterium]
MKTIIAALAALGITETANADGLLYWKIVHENGALLAELSAEGVL